MQRSIIAKAFTSAFAFKALYPSFGTAAVQAGGRIANIIALYPTKGGTTAGGISYENHRFKSTLFDC